MADDNSVNMAANDMLLGAHHDDSRSAINAAASGRAGARRTNVAGKYASTNNLTNSTAKSALKASGLKHLPVGSAAGAGVGLTGESDQASLYGQFFVGPYNLGHALRTGGINSLALETYLGAAANVLVTGWLLNVITDQPSPLAGFGLVASGAAQIGVGLFLTMQPTRQYSSQTQ